MTYDAERLRAFYDGYDREWQRLELTLQGRIKHRIHRHILERYVHPGMHVLDIGCGPGRFAIDMVQLGARVTLADISQAQLDQARKRLTDAGAINNVDGFHRQDVVHLDAFQNATFDAVVCFGGAVTYTMTRHTDALRELARVAKPGAPILISVMALLGTLRLIGPLDAASVLETFDDHLDLGAVLRGEDIVYTKPSSKEFHQPMALFTSTGLRRACIDADLDVERMATSNPFVAEFQKIPQIESSARGEEVMTRLELAYCEQPALLDAGEHLIAVARRPTRE